MKKTLISFVIPCYNSQDTVGLVIDEIEKKTKENCKYDYEIITVNDCSKDDVIIVLKKLSDINKNIKIVDLVKNVGKHGALMAGYKYCKGDIIVSLDDDCQCPVENLWDLLLPLENGFDVSIAKYGVKKQSRFKNFGSWINNFMTEILLDKPKNIQFCNFFAMKNFIIKEICRYDKPYPYLEGLILRTTRHIINVPMKDRSRKIGETGYTFKKSISLWLNGFTAFSVKPLRIATVLGFIVSSLGFFFGIYIILNKFMHPEIIAGYSSLMSAILFVGGMIMLMLGLVGEYLGRIYISINNSPQYVIREKVNIDE